MAYTLSNKCAKNLYKRTVLLQLIIKNVVTCFLEHSVDVLRERKFLRQGSCMSRRSVLAPSSESPYIVSCTYRIHASGNDK